jgi:alpha-ketoglutarate-dependent taurine dioxygenase
MAFAPDRVDEDRAATTWPGPLLVRPDRDVSLETYAADRSAWIDDKLLSHGALLFRGFGSETTSRFREVAEALCGPLSDYVYRSTPRSTIDRGVYTATEYHARAVIPMHNENAYQRRWPRRLVFGCAQPAASGGETPLARTSGVTTRIPAYVRAMFAARGVLYVRNYGLGVDLAWETAFQTTDQHAVDAYCRAQGIECEWVSDDHLRTKQVCQGLATHPVTGEELWFNQAHLFHVSSLPEEDRMAMLEAFDEADLPRNAYLGDGTPLEEPILRGIREAYEAEIVTFPWEQGDILLLDNMLVAHGRRPFTGARKILVAMSDAFGPEVPVRPEVAR